MSNPVAAVRNVAAKAVRRLQRLHHPLVRRARQRARVCEHATMAERARGVEREIADAVAGDGPIVAGPWLAEVGYEVLYWIPFLRWVQDRYRVAPERFLVISRGGVEDWYRGIASRYVDIFDHLSPADVAARNQERQSTGEAGGRKQSFISPFDEQLLTLAGIDHPRGALLHPSHLFRLFREVWQGNLPLDFMWTRTGFELVPPPPRPSFPGLPPAYIAVKFYTGTALPDTVVNRDLLRRLVRAAAQQMPVVVLDTGLSVDDHADYLFADIPNVISAREWMTARDNLGVQSALVAHARSFLGTCGGIAWLAPFMRVPTVAVYADDALLGTHLFVARQAGRRTGAAELTPLDLRALTRVGLHED